MKEFEDILREAYASVTDTLGLEDKGWINLSQKAEIITPEERKLTVTKARHFALKDPLATCAIRLMTDYSFGSGMSWTADDATQDTLELFWDSPANRGVLSPIGQRKSSDKLLMDGEIFFALFLGQEVKIRRIDPLQITEIITDPDDIEDVRYYKREWVDRQIISHTDYYRSFRNEQDKATPDMAGKSIRKTQDALIYHIAINDLVGLRGNSYLLPAISWIELYRKFLASRVAIMLALAKFAWKLKTKGGPKQVADAKETYDEEVSSGSMHIENEGLNLQPIKTDSGARNAYEDGRMIKLQVSAATGWPEQYFGDISIGNLATAKTVELPVMKMCQSYQELWKEAYNVIDDKVLDHANISEDKRYIDRDFPDITPEDAADLAKSIQTLVMTFPEFAGSRDVMQRALMSIGITDTNEVIDKIMSEVKRMPEVKLAKVLKEFRRAYEMREL